MNKEELKLAKYFQKEMMKSMKKHDFETLKKYFTPSDLTNNEIYSDLQYNINNAFKFACIDGSLPLVKYLLTSPELPIHADIHFEDDVAIYSACEWCYKHIVDYLLMSSELKENAKLPKSLDDIFEFILIDPVGGYSEEEILDRQNFIKHLIFQHKVNPTQGIINVLQEHTIKDFWEPILCQLARNELFNSLEEELGASSNIKAKSKI